MLQFIAKNNDKYSIPELVQMAIEGGCRWVVLQPQGLEDHEIRELAAELVPLCRENEVILTMYDHLELAKELGIHGLLLSDGKYSLREARDICGPEAIIGMVVENAAQAMPMKDLGLDLDYVAFTDDMPVDAIARNMAELEVDGFTIPTVASGDYAAEQVPSLIATGVSGLALGAAIADAPDPVEITSDLINLLKKK